MNEGSDKIVKAVAAEQQDGRSRRQGHWRSESIAASSLTEEREQVMSSTSSSPAAETPAGVPVPPAPVAEGGHPPAPAILPEQGDFRPTVRQMLRWYALGWYPCYLLEINGGPVGWRKYSHRGVQWLTDERIHVGKKQKRDVFDERFVVKYDTAFNAVVEGCADPSTHGGATWVTPGLKKVYAELFRLGYAHSFECWQGDQLVGGSFGIQLGEVMTVESMFHTADNASKAAYVRTLYHLKERGFKVVDINHVTPFFERFGGETMRQWEFEEVLKNSLKAWPSFAEDKPAPNWPAGTLAEVAMLRKAGALGRRVKKLLGRAA
jgi:leucyl/phenylalanyl-tRNA--protein transferase